MAAGKCDACGADEYMPFVCKFCRGKYCAAHRLPENHGCAGLGEYRERVRAEGRIMAPEPGVAAPQLSMQARIDQAFARFQGRLAYWVLGAIAVSYLIGFLVAGVSFDAYDAIFVLDRHVLTKPWTLVTSLLAHDLRDPMHVLVNGLMLFFFGPSIEKIIGSRRFFTLFVGGGIVAGLAQLLVFNVWLAQSPFVDPATGRALAEAGIIGASGAILALLGALTILAPKLTILVFFVIPAPLWVVTAFYAFIDLLGALTALLDPGLSTGVANFAHLAGLATGLAFGKRLHDRGLRVQVQKPQPAFRRYP